VTQISVSQGGSTINYLRWQWCIFIWTYYSVPDIINIFRYNLFTNACFHRCVLCPLVAWRSAHHELLQPSAAPLLGGRGDLTLGDSRAYSRDVIARMTQDTSGSSSVTKIFHPHATVHTVIFRTATVHSVIIRNATVHTIIIRNATVHSVIIRNTTVHTVIIRNATVHSVIIRNATVYVY
jgi:hypothetical protein